MKTDAFAQLEDLCQSPVPLAIREVLTNYPEILRGVVRADDGSESEGFVSDAELLADPSAVLRVNQEVRQGSIFDPDGQEFCWPNSFLVIGETGDGDYYCVDTTGMRDGVMQFRHHTVEFEMVAESIPDFIELLVECFVADEDNQEFADINDIRIED